jgi:hypothetical protein
MLGPDTAQPLAFAIDAYLDAAHRAQNALVPYIARVFARSLPSGISDLVKSIQTGKRSIDAKLDALLIRYWGETGGRLKDYRDLAQHFALVSSDVRVFFIDSQPHTFLALPNNPEVKSPAALRYRDPIVPAYKYCRDSFLALFRLAYETTYVLARRLGPLEQLTMLWMPKDPIIGGAQPGQPAPPASDLSDALLLERRSLKDACSRDYGALHEPAA